MMRRLRAWAWRVAGLFTGQTEVLEFHTWRGDDLAASPWTAFEYAAPQSKLAQLLGKEFTFDIYAHTWDSEFYFDTLSLEVSLCEEP